MAARQYGAHVGTRGGRRMIEALKAIGRSGVRAYVRTGWRGRSRLRSLTDPLLAPEGGTEVRRIGPCKVALSHQHEATRNMAYDCYEPLEFEAIATLVSPGDTVVDGGANVGYFAARLAEMVGHEGRVYAFEPGPTPLQLLQRVAASSRTIEAIGCALSDRSRETVFFETANILARGYGRIDKRPSAKFAEVAEVPVRAVSLDDFFQDRDPARLSFVKIDVEGHETEVVAGMKRLFQSGHRPAIMTEATIDELHIGEVRAYAALLMAQGYRMHAIGRNLQPVEIDAMPKGFHGNVMWLAGRGP
jgi:FkbM family methyltransferase